jgi:hypothetical protein
MRTISLALQILLNLLRDHKVLNAFEQRLASARLMPRVSMASS